MLQLASIIVLGILAQWLAWKSRVPAILPLIIIGLIVGPFAAEWLGFKLIQPTFDPNTGEGLFPNHSISYFVSLAIGIILFEGGLTLKRDEIKGIGNAIIKLITVGSLVTFVCSGLAAHFVLGLNYYISFLFAGLIIVTGPTVISPILRNVPLTKNISTVLKWEGILIDPIGALVAVLVFEFIIATLGAGAEVGHDAHGVVHGDHGGGGAFTVTAITKFLEILFIGLGLGISAAFLFAQMLKKHLIPHYLLNVFTLALVLMVFATSDYLAHESGLLTVVVMGMALANMDIPNFREILEFKEAITILLISILFIVLSANMEMYQLNMLGIGSLIVFAIVILIVRPLGVFLSTYGSDLSFREKLFISWVGPRGIVAAGIASLFGLRLTERNIPDAEMLTPLVFLIVLGTVVLNATTARFVAKLLGVTLETSNGIAIVGANPAGRLLGKYLKDHGRHVVMIDNSNTNIQEAKEMDLETFQANVFDDSSIEGNFDLQNIGYLVAITGSDEVNNHVCTNYGKTLGENGSYRLVSEQEMENPETIDAPHALFSPITDYINFSEVARDYGQIHEIVLKDDEQYTNLLSEMDQDKNRIPLFIKYSASGNLDLISCQRSTRSIAEGDQLVYMGKEILEENV